MRACTAGSSPAPTSRRVPVVRGRLAVRVEHATRRRRPPRGSARRAARIGSSSSSGTPPSRPERRGAAVVLGQQRHHLVGAVARALLDEAADLEVLARAHRLGQHPVGDVADQHVLERELALARQPALGARGEDVLLLQRRQRALEVAPLLLGERRQRALPERAADHGRLLHEPPLERLERVEPRGEHRLDACRAARSACSPPSSAMRRDHLLGEERVAARALDHRRQRAARRARRRRRAAARRRARGCRPASAARGRAGWRCAGRRPSSAGARAARRASGRAASAARAPTAPGARSASSMPSSAQWMSSNASTSGLLARHRLEARAQGGEERLAQRARGRRRRPGRSSAGTLDARASGR